MTTAPPRPSEPGRAAAHALAGCAALLLPYVSWWEALIAAGLVIAISAYALPKLARVPIHGPADLLLGRFSGAVLYPSVVAVLILSFKHRPDIVAAAWGILAGGVAAAMLAGHYVRSPRLPWNREQSVGGLIAFVLVGSSAGVALSWWCRPSVVPPPFTWFATVGPIAAAIAAAAVATMPVRLNANVTVSAAAALVLFWLSLVNTDMAMAQLALARTALPAALAINAGAALAGYMAGVVSRGGAAAGALVGTLVLLSVGWPGWAMLCATLLAAAIATRLGHDRKSLLGIAEARGGRRGAASALANTLLAAAAAVLAAVSYASGAALIAFVAALAAAGGDTVASEIGKAWGRRTYALTALKTVRPGTPGAMSLEGTAAGIVASFALAALGSAAGLIPPSAILPIAVGAFAGSLVESLLGGTLEAPGHVNNDLLNFINTGVAALVAVAMGAG